MNFKSVLGAFLFVLLASFIALVVFVQTKSFGKLVTKIVSDVSERRFQTQVKVKSFSLSVFPPGLELNNVKVKKNFSEIEKFRGEFGTIGFYIGLIEIEEKKLTFGEIKISDSYVKYTSPEKEEELKEIDEKLIKEIFRTPERLPIRIDTVIVENTKIVLNHELLEARRLKVFKKEDAFVTRFHFANLKPSNDSNLRIDEVWGDAEITRKNLTIYRLKIQHDVHTLLLKGNVQEYFRLKNSELNLKGEAQVHLGSVKNEITLPEMIDFNNGNARVGFTLQHKNQELSANVDFFIKDLKSSFLHADELRSALVLTNKKLSLNKLSISHENERINLSEPAVVFDLSDKSYLTRPLKASVENLTLGNALRILGPKLSVLRGELNGDLSFVYKNKNLFFTPKDKFFVKNLGLVVGEAQEPFTILMIKKATFFNSQFAVVNNEFLMSARIELPRSKLEVDGFVNKERLQFTVPDSQINLEDFGNISNLDIKGAGELSINVTGPLEAAVINLKGKTKGFEILGYQLDETEKNISVDLADSSVIIHKMESKLGKTSLSGNGSVNYKDADIALGITSTDTNATDLIQILHPIFKDIDFLPEDLDFKARIDVDIFGKYKLDDLKIRSKVGFTDLSAFGESLPSGAFDVSLMDQVLAFRNFDANKGKGNLTGDFVFGLKDKTMKLDYRWENLQLSSLNISKRIGLNLNSTLAGKISGGGAVKDYVLKIETTAFDTKSPNYTFEDSNINLTILPTRIIGKANILGKIINSDFNLALKNGIASQFKLKFRAEELKPFLVATFGQHIESENFTGKLEFDSETTFQDGFNNLDLTSTIKTLSFNHADFNVNYTSSRPEFIVRNSVIERWNLNIKQPDLYVVTKGEGVFGKRVSLVSETHFNSKIAEILLAPILSSEGFIRNIVRIDGKGTDFSFSVSSRTTDLDLSIDHMPVQLNNLKYDVEFANKRLSLQELSASLDNGTVSVLGDVFFDSTQPDVNLKFSIDKAEVPVLGKSAINISGDGIILGNNYPYTISGELIVNKAQIVNELNEFSNKSAGFSQVRFLPKNQESPLGKMFTINMNIKAENPMRITNSLMDVAFIGEVRLFGNPARPRGEGRISSPANSSRIFFKNNEYQLVSADINFNPKKELSNPDFDLQALTIISTYKVYPKAYGDLERFNFDLTSDPALPRNSILSLIAFGYTDEIQNSLYAKDQQSLTQVGVGSFVFDRFKISDILNKQFGLQVNLGTVIEQSTTDSLLSGRSQESLGGQGSTGLGRTRSATKIELKKRLDEELTLSVSSTMGGSIGQRQSMNLNYGLSKNIQVEGVYELRTNEEGEADIIYNSIGGDLKFRRTFK
jgi:translocation and assembly module TamB